MFLRRVQIDADAAVAQVIAQSTYPHRRTWAEDYLRSTTSDAEALTSFGPRDGRESGQRPTTETGPGVTGTAPTGPHDSRNVQL